VQAADLSKWTGDPNHPEWRRFADAVFARARGGAGPQPQAPAQPQASGWQTPPAQLAASAGAQQGELSPIAYIKKCLRLYVDGTGRARRKEYGWFFVFYFVVLFAAAIFDVLIGGINPYTGVANSQIFLLIAGLALLAPMVSAGARRAHDFGQSGWLAILTVIPYLGILAVLVFIFIPGQAGPNSHGPDPKAAPGV
jgi:uncharacterized membrane protein YhaH (DUF805 family)